jgi:hypothetical protein
MSVRSALRPITHMPALAGHRSFGARKRTLGTPNADRG